MERRGPEWADPITRLVAGRVRALRTERGISGATLGAAVRALGLRSWAPATVGKLETMRRQSITVQEWLALSVALDVPPVWLLVDPNASTAVPIANGVEADPHQALLWLTGRVPLTDPPGAAWDVAARMLGQLQQIAALTERHAQLLAHREIAATLLPDRHGEADNGADDDRQELLVLHSLARPLAALHEWGYPLPPLPCDLVKRADALGVELPGVGSTVEPEGGERDG